MSRELQGRVASREESDRHEAAFVDSFIPKGLADRVRACLAHRSRRRQKYRDDWSGFVSHLPGVPEELISVAGPDQVRALVAALQGVDCYIMTDDKDWDGKVVTVGFLVDAMIARRRPRGFLASCLPGRLMLWRGEDGDFVIRL